MRHLFTKNSLPLSWAIRKASGDPCSHYALEFPHLGIVLHSNLVGCHPDGLESFMKHNTLVMVKEIPTSLEEELKVWNEMRPVVVGRDYDFLALGYQAIRVFEYDIFGREIPNKNSWDNRTALLCTELYDFAPESITPTVEGLENLAMVRPYQLGLAIGAEIV